ncbi:hypothetical protein CU098_008384 [Rhizopus stolonifer]|uniref:Uncharacterized protein n=1 Tax=Rhizopus stolonifer TaxID=4846 RepID=A0A367KA09_RHIST|nr:hypothetical protein CU098_008384 [Rhizopus stolonifer]
MEQQTIKQQKMPMHSRTSSCTQSIRLRDSRNSMDLIEGTTQQFPQGNRKRPESTATLDAHLQRQRWDAFFEAQYSFGAFVQGSEQTEEQDQEVHQKKVDRLIDDGNLMLEPLKSPRSSTRPSCDGSMSHCTASSTPTAGILTPTLPCLTDNRASMNKQIWGPRDEKTLIERLELLKKIRVKSEKQTQGDQKDAEGALEEDQSNNTISKNCSTLTARWRQKLVEKAKKLRKEAQDDAGSTLSSDSSSLDPDEKQPDMTNGAEEEQNPKFGRCRRSFVCFMLGFLFPPFWLFGAFYVSSYADRQTSASRRVDRIWRHRSRIAFGTFTIALMIILVIVFVLKPETVGWRHSKLQSLQ